MGPPDGRYLAARSEDEKGLLPFNLHFPAIKTGAEGLVPSSPRD